jgi:hypothetical protein
MLTTLFRLRTEGENKLLTKELIVLLEPFQLTVVAKAASSLLSWGRRDVFGAIHLNGFVILEHV